MSTTALHRRLRQQMPWLTPQWAGEDDPRDALKRLPRVPIPVDDEAEAAPEFGEPYGTVPALRRPFDNIDRIANLGEANPLPLPESDVPLLSRTPQMPVIRPRPTVALDEGGRPSSVVFGGDADPEQRVLARRRALESYQPQKESKKSLLLRTLLGQLRGGLIGQGGSLDTLLGQGGVLDRRGKDRAWRDEQLGQTDATLGRMRTDRRAGLQDRLLESQVEENETDVAIKRRTPAVKDIVSRDGRILRPNAQGGYDEVFAPPVKPPALQRPQTGRVREGSTVFQTEYDPETKRWRKSLDADGKPIVIDETAEKLDPNIGKYEAAKGLLDDLSAQEEAARVAKDQAWVDYHAAKAKYAGRTDRKYSNGTPILPEDEEEVVAARKRIDDAEKDYKSFWSKKNEVKADMERYKPRAAPALRSQPDTRKGTISKEQQQRWLNDNPNKTLDDMKKLYPNARMLD